MPMRLLVKFGMMCPVHAWCGSWGISIFAVADDIIVCPAAVLTVMSGVVLLMLETGAVVMK